MLKSSEYGRNAVVIGLQITAMTNSEALRRFQSEASSTRKA